jgi:hypothetical protein
VRQEVEVETEKLLTIEMQVGKKKKHITVLNKRQRHFIFDKFP